MNTDNKLKLAVLIDAENISASASQSLFVEVGKRGEANIRRIYGDWGKHKDWKEVISEYAIQAIHLTNTRYKNGADIGMIVDAMDILLNPNSNIDGFCIVSSDSDFTQLAIRIREAGKQVIGFGEEKAPKILKQACHEFVTLSGKSVQESPQVEQSPQDKLNRDQEVVIQVKNTINNLPNKDGWVSLSVLGKKLKEQPIQLTSEGQKYALLKFLRKVGGFEFNSSNQVKLIR